MKRRTSDEVPRKERTSYNLYPRNVNAVRSASVPKPVPENKDVILDRIFPNVPRRGRTTFYEHVPPQDSPKPPEVPISPPQPTQTPRKWLAQVMSRMNDAVGPKLIIEKTLDLNDVDPLQNRLSIPIDSVIQDDFLTTDETRIVDDDDISNQGTLGVGAFLVDQRTRKWNVIFKQWYMTTSSGSSYWVFVLRGEWSHVVETNKLKAGDKITLWSFRSGEYLCFALVPPTSSVVLLSS